MVQFPSNRFGMPGQQQWSSVPSQQGRQTAGTTSPADGSGDIQAWLQYAFTNQLGTQQAQSNTAVQPTSQQGINSGMSLQDLQGRIQTAGTTQTGTGKTKGKGKTGGIDPSQDIGDQIKQLTQSVMAKKQAASQANAMGMPEQAIAQLKAAFGEIASVQQSLEKSDSQGQKNPSNFSHQQRQTNAPGPKKQRYPASGRYYAGPRHYASAKRH